VPALLLAAVVAVPAVPLVVEVRDVVTTVPGVTHLDILQPHCARARTRSPRACARIDMPHTVLPGMGTSEATCGAVHVAVVTAAHGAHVAAALCVTGADVAGGLNMALVEWQMPNVAPDAVEHERPGAHAGPLVAHLQYSLPGVQSLVMHTPCAHESGASHVLLE
jgi:hypothetical protein